MFLAGGARVGSAPQVYRLVCMHSLMWRKRAALIALAWGSVVLWAVVIFVLSSHPGDPETGGARLRPGWEKAAHLFVYATLAVGVANGLTVSGVRSRRSWWTFVICALYAVSDELHQAFVPGRTPLVSDVAIDVVGGWIGYATHAWLSRLRIPIKGSPFGLRSAEPPGSGARVRMRGRAR